MILFIASIESCMPEASIHEAAEMRLLNLLHAFVVLFVNSILV